VEAPTTTTTFAISYLYFGDGNNGQWKQYGINLDGLDTNASSTDVCQPSTGGSMSTLQDAPGGLDNSFGYRILPILLALFPNFASEQNNAIAQGNTTLLFSLVKPSTCSASPFLAHEYLGAKLSSQPKFDGTDVWPIDNASVIDPMDSTSAVTQNSNLTNDVLTVTTSAPITVRLLLNTGGFDITIHNVTSVMQLDPTHTTAKSGIIAGVINTEELVAAVSSFMNRSMGLSCNSSLIQNLITQIRQSSDILSDRTQDSTKTCNGISIGLGFNASIVQLGNITEAESFPASLC